MSILQSCTLRKSWRVLHRTIYNISQHALLQVDFQNSLFYCNICICSTLIGWYILCYTKINSIQFSKQIQFVSTWMYCTCYWDGYSSLNDWGSCNSLLVKERRTKMQRGILDTCLIKNKNDQYKNNKRNVKTYTAYLVTTNTETGTITHQHTVKPRLPKYGSQSETMTNTCLWLRTISGQT